MGAPVAPSKPTMPQRPTRTRPGWPDCGPRSTSSKRPTATATDAPRASTSDLARPRSRLRQYPRRPAIKRTHQPSAVGHAAGEGEVCPLERMLGNQPPPAFGDRRDAGGIDDHGGAAVAHVEHTTGRQLDPVVQERHRLVGPARPVGRLLQGGASGALDEHLVVEAPGVRSGAAAADLPAVTDYRGDHPVEVAVTVGHLLVHERAAHGVPEEEHPHLDPLAPGERAG